MSTNLVLDALEQAVWTRTRGDATVMGGLIRHTDRRSQRRFKGARSLAPSL